MKMRHLSLLAAVLALVGFAHAGELPDSWDPRSAPPASITSGSR